MAKIFITGSADGLGRLAAKELVKEGHEVLLHARNAQRCRQALKQVPGAAGILSADLSSVRETKSLAEQANTWGTFDAVIHNAGVYRAASHDLLNVNILAPYILTCQMGKPDRLIYLSSGSHLSGNAGLTDHPSYSDTKIHVLMLAKACARRWPEVYANAVDPGWVPKKMGGPGAPDDLAKGWQTQVWLAASNAKDALVSGQYFYHQRPARYNPAADDLTLQQQLLAKCASLTGVDFR